MSFQGFEDAISCPSEALETRQGHRLAFSDMPFQLLLLLVLSARAECLTGTNFVVVFPENIAYYFPTPPENKMFATGLHAGTEVTVTPAHSGFPYTLQPGEIKEFAIRADLELGKGEMVPGKVITIASTKDITLEILSQKNNSVQSALIFPTEKLGNQYRIPPIPKTGATTTSGRSPFKLIIVTNQQDANKISVEGGGPYDLHAGHVLQIWVDYDMAGKLVTGEKPFLALFTDSCSSQFDCTCGLLYTPLQPSISPTDRFIVPGVFSEGAQGQTYLLKPSTGKVENFKEGIWSVSGSLLLQRPGLLLHLIPEAEFGSCFAIHTVKNANENWAVIVAPASSTAGVQIGNAPVPDNWKPISGKDNKYKYTKVKISSIKAIIWNKSELMAVWFVGRLDPNQNVWFGNPAARLSVYPDFRGCAMAPETVKVLDKKVSWKEAIQECKKEHLSLISLSDMASRNQIYKRILDLKLGLTELWMGMRKRSYTGEWYWLNAAPQNNDGWSIGFPSPSDEENCAQINLKDPENPGWMSNKCCNLTRPVCYGPPQLVTI